MTNIESFLGIFLGMSELEIEIKQTESEAVVVGHRQILRPVGHRNVIKARNVITCIEM